MDWKIVLIDDEPDIRDVMSVILRDAGYVVFTAPDGETGLQVCESESPQIVITDIRMPGMNGLEVLEALKKKSPDTEVIVVTAFGEMDTAIRALQLDASDFVTKPVNDEAIRMALKRAKERYRSGKKLADYTAMLEKENADMAMILHQDKMMSMGRLAASVVHEINNPLSGILNYLRLMMRILKQKDMTSELRQKFQRYLELVENETSRCSQIVSGLLSFSRKSPPAFSQVSVEELLNRSKILSQHKLELGNILLGLSITKDIPPVHGDFNQLQQCLINLIFNAIDAMPDGGRLRLEGGYDADKNTVIIKVEDSGCGIEDKDLPHIFEPFFTTKKEGYGVGLGLSTVYGIIERHKGSIQVESHIGTGTVFTIFLPL